MTKAAHRRGALANVERAAELAGKLERRAQQGTLLERARGWLRAAEQIADLMWCSPEDVYHCKREGLARGRMRRRSALVRVVVGATGAEHEIRRAADGSEYCSCPAWRFQNKAPGLRSCKHLEHQPKRRA